MTDTKTPDLQKLMWGAVLIVIGVLFTLGNLGYGIGSLWQYSPLILVAIGIGKIVQPDEKHDRASGLTWVLLGLWLLANFLGLFGLRFRSSWPLLLIIFGLEIVVRSLTGRSSRRDRSLEDANGQR
jgi:hypothetical protein